MAHTKCAQFRERAAVLSLREGVSPTTPFDFLEIRAQHLVSTLDGGSEPEPNPDGGTAAVYYSIAAKGTACATADTSACRTALAAVTLEGSEGWPTATYGGNGAPSKTFAVYTRGSEVGKLTTPAELASFLGRIDTLGEARLVALAAAYADLSCDVPTKDSIAVPSPGWRRNSDGSWEIIAVYDNCGPGITRMRYKVSASGTAEVVNTLSVSTRDGAVCGRRPDGLVAPARTGEDVGAYFAEIAWLEAAAVVAFRRVENDLRALGAPASLVAAAQRAQADEIRHAREASALARRFGTEERALDVAPPVVRDRLAIALENAVEGCVRETYGALVAAYQARTAQDPAVRGFFARIAGDEARHAELSHAIAAWIEPTLDAKERAAIAAAKEAALAELVAAADVPVAAFAVLAGLPSARDARALLAGLDREILAAA